LKKASTKRLYRLPTLERLVLDTDVNARVERYLSNLGFDVVFALRTGVDIRDDAAIVRWAKKNRRILVAHDKWADRKTKTRVFNAIIKYGGQAIQVRGGPSQHELSTVGRIIANREKWLSFFQDNDGICELSTEGCKTRTRAYITRQIRGVLKGFESGDRKVTSRKSRTGIKKPIPTEQLHFPEHP
jgi:hypothetical protein